MSIADELRIGAFVFTSRYEGQTAAEVLARGVATAQAAEAAEFDDVWVTEHHFVPFGVNPSALTFAGYLLGRTNTVRVGTAVTVLPLHSPVHVAEQAALLDHLSGGRFDLGVGRAQPVVDYEVIGRGVEYWQHGLPEALDLTLAALAGPVAADSELYRFREVVPEPGPASGRTTPVYLAANSPASVEMAATRGLPMLLFFDKDPDAKAAMIAEHAEIARVAGHPGTGYAHGAALFAHVTDDPAEARAVMHRAATEFVRASGHYRLLLDVPQRIPRDTPPEQIVDRLTDSALATHPVGDPQVCIDRLVDQIRRSGCRRLLCQVEIAGDHAAVLTNVERLGAEVLPEVRKRLSE
ncbi:LLM class flavin-dependent oxidoreductase [Nocardia sp. CDC159]|uniref:LLM class flavin-dependent oxidoreductase n=1 Tax=Nocardia pulmonis TaxID=2951408 RepID=A0A9X2E418_9NOCA|nr:MULTISPECIES: LLM class flavin-dependent oxidoreductase [Nocardia]MCM6773449.1 LLM class flavin-dependent oxidoreductase [Nocardia pulmonis]MCM6786336.1 LLM class flavin-dependent oxidoreductase [Nocardia sp. CDC159]